MNERPTSNDGLEAGSQRWPNACGPSKTWLPPAGGPPVEEFEPCEPDDHRPGHETRRGAAGVQRHQRAARPARHAGLRNHSGQPPPPAKSHSTRPTPTSSPTSDPRRRSSARSTRAANPSRPAGTTRSPRTPPSALPRSGRSPTSPPTPTRSTSTNCNSRSSTANPSMVPPGRRSRGSPLQGHRHRLPRRDHRVKGPVRPGRTLRVALPHRRTRRPRNDAALPHRHLTAGHNDEAATSSGVSG
jgi:hypothetical protein